MLVPPVFSLSASHYKSSGSNTTSIAPFCQRLGQCFARSTGWNESFAAWRGGGRTSMRRSGARASRTSGAGAGLWLMRKEIIGGETGNLPRSTGPWLDLEHIARVRVTSEDPSHPIEAALRSDAGAGWRAAVPGEQTIWLHFDAPQSLRQIHLRFEVDEPRTQEFVLRWSDDHGATDRELLRQHYNFSPDGARVEEEDYVVALERVTVLALTIAPDIAGGIARATLRELRLR